MVRLTDQEILQKNLEEAYNSKICTFTVTKFGSVFFNEDLMIQHPWNKTIINV